MHLSATVKGYIQRDMPMSKIIKKIGDFILAQYYDHMM